MSVADGPGGGFVGVWQRAAVIAVLAFASCKREAVTQVSGELGVEPAALAFPRTAVGGFTQQPVTLTLRARYALDVGLETAAPFALEQGTLHLEPGESRTVTVGFSPPAPGLHLGVLTIALDETRSTVLLSGEGAVAGCARSSPCRRVTEPGALDCAEEPLPDGTECQQGCLTAAQCHAGECVGQPVTCDDQNRCTVDACDPSIGCSVRPLACESTNPCQAGACDPLTGCAFVDVTDGTSCGPADCENAQVCIAGTCQRRPLPTRSSCTLPWARCVSDAVCVAGECQSATAAALQPGAVVWTRTHPSGGFLGPLAMDVDGNVYLRANQELISIDPCGVDRWRTSLASLVDHRQQGSHALLVDGDRVVLAGFNKVAAFDRATGAMVWNRQLRADLGLCPTSWQDCDLAEVGNFFLEKASISHAGKLHVSAIGSVKDGGSHYDDTQFFLQYDLEGRLEWARRFNGPTNSVSSQLEGPGDTLWFSGPSWRVLDSTGAVVNQPAPWGGHGSMPLAVGADMLASLGYWSWAETDPFDGGRGLSWTTPAGGARDVRIDEAGRVYVLGPTATGPDPGFIQVVEPDGGARLLYSDAGWPFHAVLGEGSALYVVLRQPWLAPSQPDAELVCLDALTGSRRWFVSLGAPYIANDEAALSNDGQLVLMHSSRLMGVFTGRTGMSKKAPWPKADGTNGNARRRHDGT